MEPRKEGQEKKRELNLRDKESKWRQVIVKATSLNVQFLILVILILITLTFLSKLQP